MAIADQLLDLLDMDWLGREKAKVASDAVDSGIEYLINAGVTKAEFATISLTDLDIADPSTCVLGQLFNGYDVGLDALGLYFGDNAVSELGFCPGLIKNLDIDSALLTQAWRNKLTEMRTESSK